MHVYPFLPLPHVHAMAMHTLYPRYSASMIPNLRPPDRRPHTNLGFRILRLRYNSRIVEINFLSNSNKLV